MINVAILDLYNGEANQGMRAIQEIIGKYKSVLNWKIFDIRQKSEVPKVEDYDIYISSGGPGSPLDGDGVWNQKWYDLIDELWEYNKGESKNKKYVFFICHSFQMACDHFDLARLTKRQSKTFGIYPLPKTQAGKNERYFDGLGDSFCIGDFRAWQVIEPDYDMFLKMGARILALEKKRPHVPLERAIMAIRFSEEMFGVQFHPEADSEGMMKHFSKPEAKASIIKEYGEEKFKSMMEYLLDPNCITLTNQTIIPRFLEESISKLTVELA